MKSPKIKRPYKNRRTHGPLNSPQEGLIKPEPYLNFLDSAEEITEAPPLGEEFMYGPGELHGDERRTSALTPTAHLLSSGGKRLDPKSYPNSPAWIENPVEIRASLLRGTQTLLPEIENRDTSDPR